jgi:hypothetical protein
VGTRAIWRLHHRRSVLEQLGLMLGVIRARICDVVQRLLRVEPKPLRDRFKPLRPKRPCITIPSYSSSSQSRREMGYNPGADAAQICPARCLKLPSVSMYRAFPSAPP